MIRLMSRDTIRLDGPLYDYYRQTTVIESDVHRALRERTAELAEAGMQIAAEQGQFMAWLARVLGVRRGVEVGTFTGYSALRVAEAMPADGRLIACDVSERWTSIAREYWGRAGVADRIELRLGPALRTLDAMLEAGDAGRFDYAFIDADKQNYDGYYERALKLLRPGGVVLIDNVLWDGKVADPANTDADTEAIRAINRKVFSDERVDASMVPIGDGLTLARKR